MNATWDILQQINLDSRVNRLFPVSELREKQPDSTNMICILLRTQSSAVFQHAIMCKLQKAASMAADEKYP